MGSHAGQVLPSSAGCPKQGWCFLLLSCLSVASPGSLSTALPTCWPPPDRPCCPCCHCCCCTSHIVPEPRSTPVSQTGTRWLQVPQFHFSSQMAKFGLALSPSALGLSQLWEQYVMDPKPAPAWSLCCPAPHLGTCSDLQRPLCVPQVLSCPWQLAGWCWTWQSTTARALGSGWGPCPWGLTESGGCQVPSSCLLCWAVPSLAVLQQTKAGFGEVA